jgi:tRNA (cytidine32/uridine32-2'-O)-methyltransferase
MLENIKIVLVRTYHPGNIGSAARAMKTMGMNSLFLVDPKQFPDDEAIKMARSASDVISWATVVDSVYEAVKDCSVVIASTARPRGFDLPELIPEKAAEKLKSHAQSGKVALLFGPERMGLSNDDLQYANYRVTILTSPYYPSLNMAAAVQTLCYEVFKRYSSEIDTDASGVGSIEKMPSIESLERLYLHVEETLKGTGFIFKKHPGKIMKKIRSLIAKAELTETEVNMLRGILTSVQKK